MVHAMTEDLGGELRRLLAERGMSLRELARRVPCDSGNLSKIARGLKQPSPELAARFDDVLGSQGLLSALASQARPAGQFSPDSEEDVRRRAFLGIGLYGGIEALRQRVDGTLDPVTTSRDAEEWERATAELPGEVGHLPPLQVLPGLLADLHEAEARLSGAPTALRQRLVRVCGQLAALTAITLCNLGERDSARRYWRTAVRAADQSGDHALQALLLGRRLPGSSAGRAAPCLVPDRRRGPGGRSPSCHRHPGGTAARPPS
jgi:transcriptional regulator with XRE-family HTH domain